ncbi:sodium/potassium-transporting ATPase subunit alpha-4 [Hydra vulgaris]|uniref:Sodium/potassium-transporting ATPase subunit alpha-4 n=1 Tax=Hydra vulgaris TaxID=6087 RepID=A0ABM4B9L8_HYDVU
MGERSGNYSFGIENQIHSLSLDEICYVLNTDLTHGVKNIDAKVLLKVYGCNKYSRPKKNTKSKSAIKKLLPCIYSKADWSKKDWDRVFNYRINKTHCVTRECIKKNITGRNLVKGDIIHLECGQIVPADIIIFQYEGCLIVDNRIITGNKFEKKSNIFTNRDFLHSENVVFAGTELLSGKCVGIVIATGNGTIFGNLTKVARKVRLTHQSLSSFYSYSAKPASSFQTVT